MFEKDQKQPSFYFNKLLSTKHKKTQKTNSSLWVLLLKFQEGYTGMFDIYQTDNSIHSKLLEFSPEVIHGSKTFKVMKG